MTFKEYINGMYIIANQAHIPEGDRKSAMRIETLEFITDATTEVFTGIKQSEPIPYEPKL